MDKFSFWGNFKKAITKDYFNFKGCATRKEYWYFQLVHMVLLIPYIIMLMLLMSLPFKNPSVLIIASLIIGALGSGLFGFYGLLGPLGLLLFPGFAVITLAIASQENSAWLISILCATYFILCIYCMIPHISIGVRRLHDRGWSGWWILLTIFPSINTRILVPILLMGGARPYNKVLLYSFYSALFFGGILFILVLHCLPSKLNNNPYRTKAEDVDLEDIPDQISSKPSSESQNKIEDMVQSER